MINCDLGYYVLLAIYREIFYIFYITYCSVGRALPCLIEML